MRLGLLRWVRMLHSGGAFYVPTRAGLEVAGALDRTPLRISHGTAVHLAACARLAAAFDGSGRYRVSGERWLRAQERDRGHLIASVELDAAGTLHHADLVLEPTGTGGLVAVEVDLTAKSDERLRSLCHCSRRRRATERASPAFLATPGGHGRMMRPAATAACARRTGAVRRQHDDSPRRRRDLRREVGSATNVEPLLTCASDWDRYAAVQLTAFNGSTSLGGEEIPKLNGRAAAMAFLCTAVWSAAFLGPTGVATSDAVDSSGVSAPAVSPGAEIPELRTMYSDTYEGANGTAKMVVSAAPVNFVDASGQYEPIDDTFVSRDGAFENVADRYSASVPVELGSTTTPGDVTVGRAGDQVSFRLRGAFATAQVSGDTALYADALAGTDVRVEATSLGLKEALVLKDSWAPVSYAYDLALSSGLVPSLDAAGEVEIRDGSGSVVFRMPAPVATDAHGVTGPATFALAQSAAGAWTLGLRVDAGWLSASDRAFPVTVDPTTTTLNRSQSCWLDSTAPSTSRCADTTLQNVTTPTGDTKRTIVEFGGSAFASIPYDAEIVSASASFSTAGTQSTTNPITGLLYNVKTAWDSSATWYKPIAGGPDWPGGTPLDTAGSSAQLSVPANAASFAADITPLVQDWLAGKYGGNFGLGLTGLAGGDATNGTTTLNINADSSHVPTVSVTYFTITGQRALFTYDRQQLDDTTGLAVNVGTGDVELQQSLFHEPGPSISLDEDVLYDSRRFATPTDLSRGWKFTLGSETACPSPCGSPSSVLDGPDGSVTMGTGGSVPAANGQNGNGFGDGTFAAWEHSSPTDVVWYGTTMLGYGVSSGSGKLANVQNRDGTYASWTYYWPGDGKTCVTGGQVPYHLPGFDVNDWTSTRNGTGLAFSATGTCPSSAAITKLVDRAGRTWTFGYDASGRLHTITDPTNAVTTYNYDANSELAQVTDPNGNITLLSYDPDTSGHLGRLTKITRETPQGAVLATTSYAYGSGSGASPPCLPNEHYTRVTDPVGRVSTYCFDSRWRMTHFIDPAGHDRDQTTYGSASGVATYRPATGQSSSTFTNGLEAGTGVVTGTTSPSGATTHSDMAEGYLPADTIDAQNQRTNYSYTAGHIAQINAVREGVANQPEQLHLSWLNGEMTGAALGVTGAQQTWNYAYGSAGLVTQVTPPAGTGLGLRKMTYDTIGRLATSTDGVDAHQATYTYDGLSRLLKVAYPDASSVAYSYDNDGNLVQRTDPTGTATFTYDALNRLTSETYGGQSVNYDYYADGQLHDLTDAGGTVTYGYNTDGELASVSDPATRSLTDPSTGQPAAVTAHWDTDQPGGFPHGLMTELDEPLGTNGSKTGDLKTVYTYDADDRVASITTTNPSGQTLQRWTYSYINAQDANRPTALRQVVTGPSGQTTTYTYDYLNRLIDAKTTDAQNNITEYKYCYNGCVGHSSTEEGFSNILSSTLTAAGSSTTTDYTYNSADQLVGQTGGGTFAYDAAGNLTTSPTASFQYNLRDQVAQLTPGGGAPLALSEAGSTNDLLATIGSSRLENTALGVSASTALDGTGGTYFTRTPSGALLDSRDPTGGSLHYYLTDDRQSVTITSSATGSADQSPITYDPFGKPIGAPQPTIPTFGFDGGYQALNSGTAATDLIHFGARLYEPLLHSWTQLDPVSSWGSLLGANPYLYATDDPINMTDDNGRCVFDHDIGPPNFTRGKYSYWELCGRNGHRIGYVRTLAARLSGRRARSLFGRIVEVGAGGVAIVGGAVIGTICAAGSDGVEAPMCYKASAPLVAGGAMLVGDGTS